MTARHSSYEELAAGRRDSDEYREGYAEARRRSSSARQSAHAAWPWDYPRSNSQPALT